ncbi:MAG: DUF1361 domain-containing protein [Candidatus Eisenbacteria bacterium]|nr:DUF1361 domain-containing protein [Candidatus Eisenbacteria bacterium]
MTRPLLALLHSPRTRVYTALILWCALLVAARAWRAGAPAYFFLCWNLFLAGVPAGASILFAHECRPGGKQAGAAAWFAVWLLFLPNAPYLVTDFIHLHARPPVPLWFDIALLTSFAGAGLLLGWGSVAEVHDALTRARGRAAGWSVAVAALLLSGYGIYLGRFLRWNSWDAFSRPGALLDVMTRHARGHDVYQPASVTLVYGAGLVLGYVAVRMMGRSFESAPVSDRRRGSFR